MKKQEYNSTRAIAVAKQQEKISFSLIASYLFLALSLSIVVCKAALAETNALAATCETCHGENGQSTNSLWPNIAGQKEQYISNELQAFRNGERSDPVMSAQAKSLTDSDISALAAYYAKQVNTQHAQQDINQAGLNVRARCVSCHGMTGRTVTPNWPNIAGQQKDYLVKQLTAFKNDTRPGSLMNVIAKELTVQQINDVAEYYSQTAP